MFSPRNCKLLVVVVFFLLAMLACNFPNNNPTPTQDSILVYTEVAQTLEAEVTQMAIEGSPMPLVPTTQPPAVHTNTPPLPTRTPVHPSNTPAPSPTTTSAPCDKGDFVEDVTIEDGTEISAGEPFEKIWRLKNSGSCTWTSGYDLVFESGNQMGAPDIQQLTAETVDPGQEIDIHVNFVAPDDPGKYRGNFKLRNTAETVFGLGEKSKPFWAEIRVPDESGVRLDFLARAKDADWSSGTEPVDFANPGHMDIAYGGPDTDEDGFVLIKDAVKLESGKTSGKILQTHPKWVDDGYIVGKYPAYEVGPGDYVKGQLGFIALEDGSCGVGDVVFEIYYAKDDDHKHCKQYKENHRCALGSLLSLSISIEFFEGDDLDLLFERVAQESGYQIKEHWLQLFGFCADCKS